MDKQLFLRSNSKQHAVKYPNGYYIVKKDGKLFSVGWFDSGTINDLDAMRCYTIKPSDKQSTMMESVSPDSKWMQVEKNVALGSKNSRYKHERQKKIIQRYIVLRDARAVWLELYPESKSNLKYETVLKIINDWRKKNEI